MIRIGVACGIMLERKLTKMMGIGIPFCDVINIKTHFSSNQQRRVEHHDHRKYPRERMDTMPPSLLLTHLIWNACRRKLRRTRQHTWRRKKRGKTRLKHAPKNERTILDAVDVCDALLAFMVRHGHFNDFLLCPGGSHDRFHLITKMRRSNMEIWDECFPKSLKTRETVRDALPCQDRGEPRKKPVPEHVHRTDGCGFQMRIFHKTRGNSHVSSSLERIHHTRNVKRVKLMIRIYLNKIIPRRRKNTCPKISTLSTLHGRRDDACRAMFISNLHCAISGASLHH